jgi:hypothetical protein
MLRPSIRTAFGLGARLSLDGRALPARTPFNRGVEGVKR